MKIDCTTTHRLIFVFASACLLGGVSLPLRAQDRQPTTVPTTQGSAALGVGEQVPSEDDLIKDLHSLGLINGQTDIFRSACPVRDLAKKMSSTQPSADDLKLADVRTQHLYDLGIRTIISFQASAGEEGKKSDETPAVALESRAAQAVGIRYVSLPIANSGPDSLETMSDQQVLDLMESVSAEIFADAKEGGVLFHCSAGHDRTGIVAAFLRLKYEHWPVEQAIAEMRRYGHNWPKYSHDGGVHSWHEQHLRAIAVLLAEQESSAGAVKN